MAIKLKAAPSKAGGVPETELSMADAIDRPKPKEVAAEATATVVNDRSKSKAPVRRFITRLWKTKTKASDLPESEKVLDAGVDASETEVDDRSKSNVIDLAAT